MAQSARFKSIYEVMKIVKTYRDTKKNVRRQNNVTALGRKDKGGKINYTNESWLHRFKHYIKRVHTVPIVRLMKEEEVTGIE